MYGFIKEGNFLKIKGIAAMDKYDQEITISNVSGIRKGTDNRSVRTDLALNKRVELHCHTKMSDMDGVSRASDIIDQAIKWGHKAVAITDHGVVQAFTEPIILCRSFGVSMRLKEKNWTSRLYMVLRLILWMIQRV